MAKKSSFGSKLNAAHAKHLSNRANIVDHRRSGHSQSFKAPQANSGNSAKKVSPQQAKHRGQRSLSRTDR